MLLAVAEKGFLPLFKIVCVVFQTFSAAKISNMMMTKTRQIIHHIDHCLVKIQGNCITLDSGSFHIQENGVFCDFFKISHHFFIEFSNTDQRMNALQSIHIVGIASKCPDHINLPTGTICFDSDTDCLIIGILQFLKHGIPLKNTQCSLGCCGFFFHIMQFLRNFQNTFPCICSYG